jgi:hypothetical protein
LKNAEEEEENNKAKMMTRRRDDRRRQPEKGREKEAKVKGDETAARKHCFLVTSPHVCCSENMVVAP